MESIIQTQVENNKTDSMEFSQEFKLEMEHSICHYFNNLENEDLPKEIIRDETLVDNNKQDTEYVTPASSLKGISDFMIDQVFSTDKIIPIEYPSDDESTDNKKNETDTSNNKNKLNSSYSDDTLNNECKDNLPTEEPSYSNSETNVLSTLDEYPDDELNETISKSFAVEFISLLNINMKELNSKKDNFEVIGLKKVEDEQEKNENTSQTPEVKIKEEFLEIKPKTSKRSKHSSFFSTIERKCSFKNSHLFRSKSTDAKSSKKDSEEDSLDKDKSKKSKSRLSKFFRTVKKRMSQSF